MGCNRWNKIGCLRRDSSSCKPLAAWFSSRQCYPAESRLIWLGFVERRTYMQHQALLENYLRLLRLPTFAQNYQAFAQDATCANLSYERYLLALCQAKAQQCRANRIECATLNTKFPIMKEWLLCATRRLLASASKSNGSKLPGIRTTFSGS